MNRIQDRLRGYLGRRPTFYRILVNATWLSWDQLFRMAVGFVAGLWVARFLGVERWGVLTYSLALVGLFVPLVTLGLDGIIVRDLVLGHEKAGSILGTGFAVKAVGSLLACACSLSLVAYLRPGEPLLLVLTGILSAGLVFTSFDVIEYWYRSRTESKFAVVARNVGVAASGVAKVALVLLGAGIAAFAGAVALEYVVVAVGLVMVYSRTTEGLRAWRTRPSIALTFLREGWPLGVAAVFLGVLLQANEVVLGQMAGAREVGLYSAARRLVEVWFFVPFAVATSVGPTLVAFRSDSADVYRKKLVEVFRTLVAFSVPAALLVVLLAEPIVVLVYGNDFRDAAPPLRAYIWVLPFFSWLVVQGLWDVNEGLTRQRMIRVGLGAAVLLILDILLVPPYGAQGASISAVAAFAVAGFLGNLTSRRTWEILRLQLRSLYLPGTGRPS